MLAKTPSCRFQVFRRSEVRRFPLAVGIQSRHGLLQLPRVVLSYLQVPGGSALWTLSASMCCLPVHWHLVVRLVLSPLG